MHGIYNEINVHARNINVPSWASKLEQLITTVPFTN
jgi:hypothetical protein